MPHYKFRNVNDAFTLLVQGIYDNSIPTERKPSRVGDVLQVTEPVIVTYQHPLERVLFNQERDCNPFFHLFESLWMLAGRNDVAPLAYYSSKIGDVASDDGKTFNGAYGYRWRCRQTTRDWEFPDDPIDQLPIIIDQLRRKPESRRVVLQMWNVEDDLLKIDATKDVCCNTAAYFSLRLKDEQKTHGRIAAVYPVDQRDYWLDMTVTNRSNDMIWGMLGANVVHFSFLQEYIACALGVGVGHYHQFTNNLHVYCENNGGFHPEKWLNERRGEAFYAIDQRDQQAFGGCLPYMKLVQNVSVFDAEILRFIDDPFCEWREPFLNFVAKPMCEAFKAHKARQYDLAREAMDRVRAQDWQIAGVVWLTKRQRNWEAA